SPSASSLQPLPVVVLNAETSRPISHATITLDYSPGAASSPNCSIRRETDNDGRATVFTRTVSGAATGTAKGTATASAQWRAGAPGYVTLWMDATAGEAIPSAIRLRETASDSLDQRDQPRPRYPPDHPAP